MKVLVTGGAGFIGSHIVKRLLNDEKITYVKVLDNLSTGYIKNIDQFFKNKKFEFIEGDIRSFKTCLDSCKNMDLVSHQAALGSVPRSIKNPLETNEVNISGFLNILHASYKCSINRIVYAASSSTYGDSESLPKVENVIGNPLSPYAVTKYVNELYSNVYSTTYNLELIGLRYFNVFGPYQDPNGSYAAVIPKFINSAINNLSPTINGDGSFSRDFTFIENVVQANILSLFTTKQTALNTIYNIAYGERTSLNKLWELIKKYSKTKVDVIYGPNRKGDIPHSLADISKSKNLLNYKPKYSIESGLKKTIDWFRKI